MTREELRARLVALRDEALADAGGDWHDSAVAQCGNYLAMLDLTIAAYAKKGNKK